MEKDLKEYISVSGGATIEIPVLIVGMVCALISGMIAFPLLLKILKRDQLWYFSFYLIFLGVIGLTLNYFF